MRIRAQIAGVIDLHRYSGDQAPSVACKSVWTDRRGEEHAWWHHVEVRPGAGYPSGWEDQSRFRGGGWTTASGRLVPAQGSPARGLLKLFHQPDLPVLDDYYEPWEYAVEGPAQAQAGLTQGRAPARSKVTGEVFSPGAGPNWDAGGAGGMNLDRDPLLADLSADGFRLLQSVEHLIRFHLPRLCNHCLNPSCVAACPSGAMQKRGEDGVVVVDQVHCRGWTSCIPACPYQKVYYNWAEGKASKCQFCFPSLERGETPFCFSSCTSQVRYLGVLLYDQERIPEVASLPEDELVDGLRSLFLDASNPLVEETALRQGLSDGVLDAARRSPIHSLVIRHRVALPLHVEYRTLPALFYIPPVPPPSVGLSAEASSLFDRYLAALFSAGNRGLIREVRAAIERARAKGGRTPVKGPPEGSNSETAKEAELFRLLVADNDHRFVLPQVKLEASR